MFSVGEGVDSARGATAILAAATTLEARLESFTRTIANERLHSKLRNECHSCWIIANYCGDTLCGIHPLSDLVFLQVGGKRNALTKFRKI